VDAPKPRRIRWLGVLLVLAVGVGAWALWPTSPAPVQAGTEVPVHIARVTRTDVATRQLVPGTLGYGTASPVMSQLSGGTLTWAASPGTIVRRGQPLYRVDDQPVSLLYGSVPAWRSLELGMTSGSDVKELERNLVALGYDPGHHITVDDHFTWATAAAIDRWQGSQGSTQTGTIPFGRVAFLPAAIRVATVGVLPGTPIVAGTNVIDATSTEPSVTVALPVGQTTAHPGEQVVITLPDGTTTVQGEVETVGRVATAPSPGPDGSTQGPATIAVSIRLIDHRQAASLDQAPVEVTITEVEHRGVLAVPVTALLAGQGGSYAVQLASGTRPIVAVTVGLFDDATGLVEVSGSGLTVGAAVEVAVG
jgi:peptidoglycan hydrolase-like protein with peptidoglycan-binding domain